jgi:SAM-dependent methyltransferase
MEEKREAYQERVYPMSPILSEKAFLRADETDDAIFYATDRFVNHLDSLALHTVESVIGQLVIEETPVILDLMAGWDSHIPKKIRPSKVVGLGLNNRELARNEMFSEIVLHDLNKTPQMPFPDNTFEIVLNTVSVDYMTKPIQVFQEVGRVLKPGGLFLVIFSNRMFIQKAVNVWLESSEDERVLLVEEFFEQAGLFEKGSVFVSRNKPRPKDDKYAHLDIPSDPVYAVYADKKGKSPLRKSRPAVRVAYGEALDKQTLEKRKKAIKNSLRCPYCGERMKKWVVPENPFVQTWDNEFMYICFNDACPYFVRGWDFMYEEGNRGMSYRLMYNPEKDRCMPVPVTSRGALKESIIE